MLTFHYGNPNEQKNLQQNHSNNKHLYRQVNGETQPNQTSEKRKIMKKRNS